jgi:hypothetical protein
MAKTDKSDKRNILVKFLQAWGLLKVGTPQGVVFDSVNYRSVPFAVVTIQSKPKGNDNVVINEKVVTDASGIYQGINLPPGEFAFSVDQLNYRFPSKRKKPPYMTRKDFYQGGYIHIDDFKNKDPLLISVDNIQGESKYSIAGWINLIIMRSTMIANNMIVLMFFLSSIFVMTSPSMINNFVFFLYGILSIQTIKSWFNRSVK